MQMFNISKKNFQVHNDGRGQSPNFFAVFWIIIMFYKSMKNDGINLKFGIELNIIS